MKITLELDYDLDELKRAHQMYMGEKAKSKKDVSLWLATLVEADIQDILSHDEDEPNN